MTSTRSPAHAAKYPELLQTVCPGRLDVVVKDRLVRTEQLIHLMNYLTMLIPDPGHDRLTESVARRHRDRPGEDGRGGSLGLLAAWFLGRR
jgi:hypothetical protein